MVASHSTLSPFSSPPYLHHHFGIPLASTFCNVIDKVLPDVNSGTTTTSSNIKMNAQIAKECRITSLQRFSPIWFQYYSTASFVKDLMD